MVQMQARLGNIEINKVLRSAQAQQESDCVFISLNVYELSSHKGKKTAPKAIIIRMASTAWATPPASKGRSFRTQRAQRAI